MHGNITHFDPETGWGVVRCDDPKIDVFLHISHVKGEKQLQAGDIVNFTGCGGPNGPEAKDVILLWKAVKTTTAPNPKTFKTQTALHHLPEKIMATLPDDRIQCTHCRKQMIPKLVLSNGAPERGSRTVVLPILRRNS